MFEEVHNKRQVPLRTFMIIKFFRHYIKRRVTRAGGGEATPANELNELNFILYEIIK